MKELANYSDNHQEIDLEFVATLDNLQCTFKVGTVAGSTQKPNEDAFCIIGSDDSIVVGIFDGASSLKPIPMLEGQTGARFASHFLKDNLSSTDFSRPLDEVMIELNSRLLLASSKLGGQLSDVHTLPGSTATIVAISNNTLTFAHVADTFGIIYYKDGTSRVFTNDTNEKFDEKAMGLLTDISVNNKITPRQAREDGSFKNALIEITAFKNNNPTGDGSGVVNGDPNITRYIQSGTIDISNASALVLGSDGTIPPGWSLASKDDRDKLWKILEVDGVTELFRVKHAAEDADPDWHQLRFKHSDDATVAYINFGRSE